MSDEKISEEVLGPLKERESLLEEKLKALKEESNSVELWLSKIQSAIKALEPEPEKKSKKPVKPSPSKAKVIELVENIRKERPELRDEDGLKKEVETRLLDEGFSRAGFTLRFKEAMNAVNV